MTSAHVRGLGDSAPVEIKSCFARLMRTSLLFARRAINPTDAGAPGRSHQPFGGYRGTPSPSIIDHFMPEVSLVNGNGIPLAWGVWKTLESAIKIF
jgi:hypothetical protein